MCVGQMEACVWDRWKHVCRTGESMYVGQVEACM